MGISVVAGMRTSNADSRRHGGDCRNSMVGWLTCQAGGHDVAMLMSAGLSRYKHI